MKNYETFKSIVNQLDHHQLYDYVAELIVHRQLTLLELYSWMELVLNETIPNESSDLSIFDEHVKVNILKSLLTIPFQHEDMTPHTVMICTLHDEQHDFGMMMIDHYLTINNQNVLRSGADTPIPSIIAGLRHYAPDFLIVSVTNFYHLSKLNELIGMVQSTLPNTKIIVGGRAVAANRKVYETMNIAGVCLSLPTLLHTIAGDH